MKGTLAVTLLILLGAVHTNAQQSTATTRGPHRQKTVSNEPVVVFDHIGIGVRDLDATVDWYVKYLGFKRTGGYQLPEMGARVVFVALGRVRLELFEFANPHERPAYRSEIEEDLRRGGPSHLAVAVPDVRRFAERLRKAGVDLVIPITEFVTDIPVTFVRDPSGNLVEIIPEAATRQRPRAAPNARR
jgi:catechol 2,3-dioxygenase-like lactoylglutathione lyase family enzyme